MCTPVYYQFFFFNDTATTEIYTLSLHDALPISWVARPGTTAPSRSLPGPRAGADRRQSTRRDRKSTRLNSSHANISYAVFCLKKKQHSRRLSSLTGLSNMILSLSSFIFGPPLTA